MDALSAGKLTRTLDPVHSLVYFLPDVYERFGALGMHGRTPYFATRSAPMGAVGPRVVAATFYNFNPELVAESIPAAWEMASPQTVTDMRYAIADEALPRVLGDAMVGSPGFARAAELLRRVAESIPDADGRPLYAGHAELPWPQSTHSKLWHAITLLREHRGDGHIAALVANGLSGLEALITHTASGIGFTGEFAQRLRGWSDEQWGGAIARLRERGLLDESGALTPTGVQLRSDIEDLTDTLGFAPWRVLTDAEAGELQEFAKNARKVVVGAGVFPVGAFAERWGAHR
ncbi:MAG TPA: hypothetical protein VFB19_15850 [Mycobacterium sp.]|nr:hypothetical protein [Mycobacterium sp.]